MKVISIDIKCFEGFFLGSIWVDWVCFSHVLNSPLIVSREDLTTSIFVDNHVINTDISPAKGNLFKTPGFMTAV